MAAFDDDNSEEKFQETTAVPRCNRTYRNKDSTQCDVEPLPRLGLVL